MKNDSSSSDWSFGGTWPYEPRWFNSPDGRMHYIDEGPRNGQPVVMVHGNPTWGYLYRNFFRPWLSLASAQLSRTISDSGALKNPTIQNSTASLAMLSVLKPYLNLSTSGM